MVQWWNPVLLKVIGQSDGGSDGLSGLLFSQVWPLPCEFRPVALEDDMLGGETLFASAGEILG